MSISGISSNTGSFQQSNTDPAPQWQRVLQGREDFTLLAQALESGDLVSAQQAFANLQSLRQGLTPIEVPVQGDLAALRGHDRRHHAGSISQIGTMIDVMA
ncbi:MAG TPA: hypothetical protein VKT49_01955 [Bryobacteraceae bacterium]|nr:hypothetical protein [Bryobacteraceae bacterium]